MKEDIKHPSLLFLLLGGLASLLVSQAAGQTFTTLHNFTASETGAGGGFYPFAGLTLSSNILYGTTSVGGNWDSGTVFTVTTNGTGFRSLYSFSGGSDGQEPRCSLSVSGNTLYGTTSDEAGGGTYGKVFAINTDGTGFNILHTFAASDGASPFATLVLSSNILYGTTVWGGSTWGSGPLGFGSGTVFAIKTDGTGFASLYSFTGGSDGAEPRALVLAGNTLYGAAQLGGGSNNGTVFAVNTDGTGFNVLHSFTGGNDGMRPGLNLILSGNTLYGTAIWGGLDGYGTVFALNTDGTGFTVLHSFSAPTLNSDGVYTNSDGTGPWPLILRGNTLYGGAGSGGAYGGGTVFMLNADGTGFMTLQNFAARPDIIPPPYPTNIGGAAPVGLMLSGNMLYGMANTAGAFGGGTIFSLSTPVNQPRLAISSFSGNVILKWPSSAAGFTLESTTNFSSPVWTTNLPAPAVVNGQNTVTNSVSGAQQFYRLSQ